MGEVISAIIVLRILVQFVCQTFGLLYWHTSKPKDERPWKMYLYPLVPILSIAIWLFVFVTSKFEFIAGALGLIALGTFLYFTVMRSRLKNTENYKEEAI
jgi:amino acid transporter